MARHNRHNPRNFDYIHADILHGLEALERQAGRSNPRQDEILGLAGYRSRVLWPKFQDGGGVNSGSLSAADGRARVRGALFDRDINFLSNKGKRGGKKSSNPRQDEILGLAGYKSRVLYPKFEDGGGVNSGSLSARDGRARVGGSLFTNEINFLSNRKGGKKRAKANPRQDEILGISGYHARVLWPKFSLTGGVNSGNADYIPTSTTGSLFNREINFLSNPTRSGSAVGGPAGAQKFEGTTKHGKTKTVSVRQVLAMPQMFDEDTNGMARMLLERGVRENGRGGRRNRR
jgi:hypothetical protein